MKKLFIGALASLMLAGALSAVSPAAAGRKTRAMVIFGEGSSPMPFATIPTSDTSDGTSPGK